MAPQKCGDVMLYDKPPSVEELQRQLKGLNNTPEDIQDLSGKSSNTLKCGSVHTKAVNEGYVDRSSTPAQTQYVKQSAPVHTSSNSMPIYKANPYNASVQGGHTTNIGPSNVVGNIVGGRVENGNLSYPKGMVINIYNPPVNTIVEEMGGNGHAKLLDKRSGVQVAALWQKDGKWIVN